jgi:hypothetical protein
VKLALAACRIVAALALAITINFAALALFVASAMADFARGPLIAATTLRAERLLPPVVQDPAAPHEPAPAPPAQIYPAPAK